MASKVGANVNATVNQRIEELKATKLRGDPKELEKSEEDAR